ncbi:BolA family transcriptional regulator [soil metagenome]
MGQVADGIAAKLKSAFDPTLLEVIDDSDKHAGHMGARPEGETHFTLKITAQAFAGLSRVERQRRVNAVLAEELAPDRVHALAMTVKAPGEA